MKKVDNYLTISCSKAQAKELDNGGGIVIKEDGLKVFIHHYDGTGVDVYEELWKKADVIICCHPELLPKWARYKHPWPDHEGALIYEYHGGELVIELDEW